MTVEAIIEEIDHLPESERRRLLDRINARKEVTFADSRDLTGEALIAAMQASPHKEVSIEPDRYPLPVRDVRL